MKRHAAASEALRVAPAQPGGDADWSAQEKAVKDLRARLADLDRAARTFACRDATLFADASVPKDQVPAGLPKLRTDIVPLPR